MLERCSPRTRYERFHGVDEAIPPEHLRRCLHGDEQEAVVAEAVTSELVGLASTGPVPGEPDVRELAVLVEDRWQRKGIGRMLVDELFARAHASGVGLVRLELCRLQPGLLDYVVAHLPVAARSREGCDVTVDIRLDVGVGVAVEVTAGPPRSAPATARPRPSSAGRRRGALERT